MDCSLPRLLCPWNSPDKNTGEGQYFLLQRIFPTQGSNPGLLNCRWMLYCLSHQGNPGHVPDRVNRLRTCPRAPATDRVAGELASDLQMGESRL